MSSTSKRWIIRKSWMTTWQSINFHFGPVRYMLTAIRAMHQNKNKKKHNFNQRISMSWWKNSTAYHISSWGRWGLWIAMVDKLCKRPQFVSYNMVWGCESYIEKIQFHIMIRSLLNVDINANPFRWWPKGRAGQGVFLRYSSKSSSESSWDKVTTSNGWSVAFSSCLIHEWEVGRRS